ncbi:MAG: glycosyltransferase family 39 protein [bacterium]|nr:glycosyltransferase family 39 protein [bacterium]
MINKRPFWFIFILALAVRLAFVLFFPPLYAPDTGSYEIIAKSLIKGDGFSSAPGIPSAGRPPLYPLFLAGIYFLFGQSHLAVKLSQALLGAISCIIIYFISKEIFDRRVGLWSGAVMALYPPLISTAGFVLSEELAIFLLAISILFLTKATKRKQTGWYVLSGIFMGLTTLCRPMTLLFPFFLYLAFLFLPFKKREFFWISIFLLATVVTVAPWTFRNYVRFNAFIPVQDCGGGMNFWMATYSSSDGIIPYGSPQEYSPKDQEVYNRIIEGLSPIEADKACFREGIKNIINNPSGYFRLCARKFERYWFWIPGGVKVLQPHPKIKLGVTIVDYLVLLLAILGLGVGLRENWRDKLPLIAIILYFTITSIFLFVALPRYRLPIMPYVLIFAIVGFLRLLDILPQRCKDGHSR